MKRKAIKYISGRKKVLVIDDNAGILFIMQEALQLKDYEVEVSEIYRGVAAIEKSAPDMIYLDISFSGHDGREVARELKGDLRTKHIPIIILTAYPNAQELMYEAQADAYLAKPFELERLWDITAKYSAWVPLV